eukprot:g165.t1
MFPFHITNIFLKFPAIALSQRTVYKLKELEKIGSKAGVVEQTIKDVLQSLVDDNLVNQDKVGSINVFYSFASAQMVRRQKEVEKLKAEAENLEAEIKRTEEVIDILEKERVQTKKRAADLASLQSTRAKKAKLTEEHDTWKENDPSILEALCTFPCIAHFFCWLARTHTSLIYRFNSLVRNTAAKRADVAKTAANRWTDNIWTFERYLVKKKNIERKKVRNILGITDAFDYV